MRIGTHGPDLLEPGMDASAHSIIRLALVGLPHAVFFRKVLVKQERSRFALLLCQGKPTHNLGHGTAFITGMLSNSLTEQLHDVHLLPWCVCLRVTAAGTWTCSARAHVTKQDPAPRNIKGIERASEWAAQQLCRQRRCVCGHVCGIHPCSVHAVRLIDAQWRKVRVRAPAHFSIAVAERPIRVPGAFPILRVRALGLCPDGSHLLLGEIWNVRLAGRARRHTVVPFSMPREIHKLVRSTGMLAVQPCYVSRADRTVTHAAARSKARPRCCRAGQSWALARPGHHTARGRAQRTE